MVCPREVTVLAAAATEQAISEAMHKEVFLQNDATLRASGQTIGMNELTPQMERHVKHRIKCMLADPSEERQWERAIQK